METFSLDMLLSGGGGVLVAAASAWFAVKYGQRANETAIKEVTKRLDSLASQVAAQWEKLDTASKKSLESHAEISEKQQRDYVDLKWLRRDVDRLTDRAWKKNV